MGVNWDVRYQSNWPAYTGVGGPMAINGNGEYSARYIKFDASIDGDAYCGISEMEVYEWVTTTPATVSYGSADLALNAPVTDLTGSDYINLTPTSVNNVVDGDLNTAWRSGYSYQDGASNYNQYGAILIDLGSSHQIGKIIVTPEKAQYYYVIMADSLGTNNLFPGTSASVFKAYPDMVGTSATSNAPQTFYVDGAASARYIWLVGRMCTGTTSLQLGFDEIEVYGVNSPLTITTASLPDGTVGTAYSQSLAAAGGTAPYTWSITAGTLPDGLSLNAGTGAITGTPSTIGTASVTVLMTDHAFATVTQVLSITINSGMVSAGTYHTVGLKSDGTVVAIGDNSGGQCNVTFWAGIIQVSAGYLHTVGLKADGTVVATGDNTYGQCDVSSWAGITQVSAAANFTLGLKYDGTVVAAGDNALGQCNVTSWTNITQISAGGEPVQPADSYSLGLKIDGTVVATGDNTYGQCDVGTWTGITQGVGRSL